jgi:hypothetical protein
LIAKTIAGLRLYLLLALKGLRFVFYPTKIQWVQKPDSDNWDDLRLILILNHTSLFEFVYAGAIPFKFLVRMSQSLVFPVAEETLAHPFYGPVLKTLAPAVIPLTRKRDHTWKNFLNQLNQDSILIAMPEGRMKRSNGLDKHGRVMTVKRGVLEILQKFTNEKALLTYSGGLHHVLPPNRYLPRLFKRIAVTLEAIDIDEYLKTLEKSGSEGGLQDAVARDLAERRDRHCPEI